MTKVWKWVLGVVSVIGTILAFVLYRKFQQDHVNSLKDALVVADAEKEVAVLDVKRELLEEDIEDRGEEIAIVKDELVANKKTIVEARTKAEGLDEQAVLDLYGKLYP